MFSESKGKEPKCTKRDISLAVSVDISPRSMCYMTTAVASSGTGEAAAVTRFGESDTRTSSSPQQTSWLRQGLFLVLLPDNVHLKQCQMMFITKDFIICTFPPNNPVTKSRKIIRARRAVRMKQEQCLQKFSKKTLKEGNFVKQRCKKEDNIKVREIWLEQH